jgi:hypothetical protein
MVTLIQRAFVVAVPVAKAWEHLARVEQWPSWAAHIKRIELLPPGQLGPQSTGVIHLADGMTPAFRKLLGVRRTSLGSLSEATGAPTPRPCAPSCGNSPAGRSPWNRGARPRPCVV